jgi:hypothetical protein
MKLSRRGLLKVGGVTLAALAAPGVPHVLAQNSKPVELDWSDDTLYDRVSFNELYGNPPLLGRVEAFRTRITNGPYITSDSVRNVYLNYVMPIYGAVHGDAPYPYLHNDVWFVTADGYVHSSYVVPSREQYNPVEQAIGDGFWGELTVPMVWLRVNPSMHSTRYDFRAAYGTVFRVVETNRGDDGQIWYRLEDDLDARQPWWVQGRFVRRVIPEEFEPINPHVEDKRIDIDTGRQRLTAYENGEPVFQTRFSSGTGFTDDDGNFYDFSTSFGGWAVQRKRPSRHMVGGEAIDDYYNLPGVPWDTYFTYTGSAIHGTYWHNDFGRDRSHGCINVTHDAAKWVYRWTQPYLGYDDFYRWTKPGELATSIIVF